MSLYRLCILFPEINFNYILTKEEIMSLTITGHTYIMLAPRQVQIPVLFALCDYKENWWRLCGVIESLADQRTFAMTLPLIILLNGLCTT